MQKFIVKSDDLERNLLFELKQDGGDVDIFVSTEDGKSTLVVWFCKEDGKLHLCAGLNTYDWLTGLSLNTKGEIITE